MYPFTVWPLQLIIQRILEEKHMNTTEHSQLECGSIPKGTKVKIDGCPFVLQDDVKVAASQEIVDLAIKNQNDFYNGIGVVGEKTE